MKCEKCGYDNPEGAKFCLEYGTKLVGINSGQIVYGEIPGKITVTGDAVNIVQRLKSVAIPGKVLISSTTAKLVAGKVNI